MENSVSERGSQCKSSLIEWIKLNTNTLVPSQGWSIRTVRSKLTKLEIKKWDIIINTNEVYRIVREYLEKLHSNKVQNLKEMDKFLVSYGLT
jgi:hypothetical protein